MDTVIQKSYYDFLKKFVDAHLDILLNRRVYIFGAGPRGCNLLQLLRIYHVPDLYFVDNNPQKQGKQLDGCTVLSFSEANAHNGPCCFLCPVEGGQQILSQLAEAGYRENVDYFNLDIQLTDYIDLMKEIGRPVDEYSLAFGCCVSASNILGNKFMPSFGELLKGQLLGGNSCKICTLPGMSAPMYYYILNVSMQLHNSEKLRFVFYLIEITTFSRHSPLFVGKSNYYQSKLFLEQLIKLVPSADGLFDYYQLISERLESCVPSASPGKSFNIEKALQTVYRLKYNYSPDDIDQSNESIVHLKRMLKLLNQKNVPAVLCFTPVDYMLGERILGADFTNRYHMIVQKILSMIEGYSFSCIDASFIAASDCFVQNSEYCPDVNPILNEKGQSVALDFLRQQKAMQDLLSLE